MRGLHKFRKKKTEKGHALSCRVTDAAKHVIQKVNWKESQLKNYQHNNGLNT